MIKNERQYRITKAQASRLRQTLENIRPRSADTPGLNPRIAQAQEEAVQSQLADLEQELREYQSLRAGGFELEELHAIDGVATALIKARIARAMSHKDLAERLGLKEQQIQRYEATDYVSASLGRIREVANVLYSDEGTDRRRMASFSGRSCTGL